MSMIKYTALAATLALGMASSAQAVTFVSTGKNSMNITFNWGDAPADGFNLSEFHTTTFGYDFRLTIEEVTGDNDLVGYTWFSTGGSLIEDRSFDFSVSTCSADDGAAEGCNLQFAYEAAPERIASGLSAGEYTFGFFGKTVPTEGSITFGVSKVPLPAGGALLLGALGGFAALRRRRKS